MTYLLQNVACFLCCVLRAGHFTYSINNSVVSALAFIPSGGRVGAARLNRHMALYRV